jgi:hypothetical protein
LANALKRDIIAFADNVETGKVYDVRGFKDQQLMDQRLKILVGTSGANHPMGLTPAQYFAEGIAAGTYTTDKIVAHMTASRKMLEPLGFKTRVATIDTILEAVA